MNLVVNTRKRMLNIIVDHTPTCTDNAAVLEGLITFNEKIMGEPRDKSFSVFLKDAAGSVFGGIQAHFDRESVYIEIFWIDENFRQQGYGRKLLEAAEQEAVKQGCIASIVDTLGFQAEAFYLKNGYARMGEIPNYWYTHSRIFLRKHLK